MRQPMDWRERAADVSVQVAREAANSRLAFDAAACRANFLALMSAHEALTAVRSVAAADTQSPFAEQERLAAEIVAAAGAARGEA